MRRPHRRGVVGPWLFLLLGRDFGRTRKVRRFLAPRGHFLNSLTCCLLASVAVSALRFDPDPAERAVSGIVFMLPAVAALIMLAVFSLFFGVIDGRPREYPYSFVVIPVLWLVCIYCLLIIWNGGAITPMVYWPSGIERHEFRWFQLRESVVCYLLSALFIWMSQKFRRM